MLTSVLAAAVPAAEANPLPALWRIVTKMAYFAGLITTLGGSALWLLVLRPVLRRPSVDAADRSALTRRAGLLLAIAGTWYLVALYFQLAGKAARVKGTEIPYDQALSPAAIWRYVSVPAKRGEWISTGVQTLTQYLLWAVAAIVLMLLWSPRLRSRLTAFALSSLVLSFVAYQVTLLPTDFRKETGANLVDGLLDHTHVMAVSTWVGGITGLVALSLSVRRRLTSKAGVVWAQVWTRFGTVALCAVGCLLISGLYLAWTYVGSPSELFTTAFGRFLLVKVTMVACMIAVGGLNEFVLMPRMARARAAGDPSSVFRLALRVFPGLVLVEVVLAVGVLFVLSFLTGSARVEAGDPDPTLSGSIVATGALLAVLLAVSFVATAKVSSWLSSKEGVSP